MRLVITIAGLIVFSLGMWAAARAGGSRLFSIYGLVAKQVEPAQSAVRMSPSDPQAHLVKANILSERGEQSVAIEEYERAVRLRPRHFWLWLRLASALDEKGERQRALAAYSESVRLAPSYAEPHWQFGNALFRAGRAEEGFAEMRLAAASDPKLLPILVDLAWGAAGGDVEVVKQLVQPQTDDARLALARLFAMRGKVSEAMALVGSAGILRPQDRKAMMLELISAKRFAEAYRIWSGANDVDRDKASIAQITDGGGEGRLTLSEPGFGWQQLPALDGMSVARDTANPRSGTSSLLLDFKGHTNPSSSILAQTVLVKPNTRYYLKFAARTQDVVTGGPPLVTLIDASSSDRRVLAQSPSLQQGTSVWQDYIVEFTTPPATEAVTINIIRVTCPGSVCPIFGRVWLDDFSLHDAGLKG
jgi:Tfp pilus assembly protein PilF